ncbi:hypothetical protein H4Q26_000578 [Puccinia striiformis f. sp. tritici PST-130]|nr:hypothetical protein H4Q26_000578 [Puccinia striiformis f. sp. tritici PST-130]
MEKLGNWENQNGAEHTSGYQGIPEDSSRNSRKTRKSNYLSQEEEELDLKHRSASPSKHQPAHQSKTTIDQNQQSSYLRFLVPNLPHSQIIDQSTSCSLRSSSSHLHNYRRPSQTYHPSLHQHHRSYHPIRSSSQDRTRFHTDLDHIWLRTNNTTTNNLDGAELLIDLVRFVAKIVGLQALKGTVNLIRTAEHSDLTDLSSSDLTIPLQLVVQTTAPLDPLIIQQAKAYMPTRTTIRSISKSDRLRRASMEEEASGLATSLTLLGLGLLLLRDPLTQIISSPTRTSLAIDNEILMLLYHRLTFRLEPNNKTSIIGNLMKEDDLDYSGIPPSNQDQLKDTEGTNQSPLVPFAKIFSLLFTRHAAETRSADVPLDDFMSWNVITIDKYLSNPLRLSLIDQIESDQVCSPEYPSWLSNLILLLDGFFEFDLDRTPPSNNKSTIKSSLGLFTSTPTLSASPSSSPADSQVRLLQLIHNVFIEIRDLEEWREELLQEVVIPTLGRFLLLPAFDNPVLTT